MLNFDFDIIAYIFYWLNSFWELNIDNNFRYFSRWVLDKSFSEAKLAIGT